MATNRQTASKERTMRPTAASFIRWTGVAAMAAGLMFAGIQPIHPPDMLASVTTSTWAIFLTAKTAMSILFVLGIAGLYARQVNTAGWLGLAGFLLLSLFWSVSTAYIFAEAFILPLLATEAPRFVASFLGMFNGFPGEMNMGALPAIYGVIGLMYMLGGLLFGVATFRAGILPRWPAALLAVAATATPAAALLPHALQRLAGIPVGVAIAWLGYALWAERRENAAELASGIASPRLGQTGREI